jgi:hypothetical protein
MNKRSYKEWSDMKTLGALASYWTLLVLCALPIKCAQDEERERLNGLQMPGLIPVRNVYDVDGDGVADRTKVGTIGPGYLIPHEHWRDATQIEIDWYKSQMDKR